MDIISFADAKAHLSELVERVNEGASIEITRRGEPIVHLTAAVAPRGRIVGVRAHMVA